MPPPNPVLCLVRQRVQVKVDSGSSVVNCSYVGVRRVVASFHIFLRHS